MPALDNSKHSGRPECPSVMPDDGVGGREVVACQIESIRREETIEQNGERRLPRGSSFRTTPLRVAVRLQPASPWGPSSRRIAPPEPLQALEPGRLDRRGMHKNIFAILTADETVALGPVEPLYCSLFCHLDTRVPFN